VKSDGANCENKIVSLNGRKQSCVAGKIHNRKNSNNILVIIPGVPIAIEIMNIKNFFMVIFALNYNMKKLKLYIKKMSVGNKY